MLAVNEIFGPTIQGEGRFAGQQTMFIRLAGCNLACIWCDTPYTWNWEGTRFSHPEKYRKQDEVRKMTSTEVLRELQKLSPLTRVVLSGGEPLLQQRQLIPLLQKLHEDGYWVEVETNGTIVPDTEFLKLVNHINCSPKLRSSGSDNLPYKKTIRDSALRVLSFIGNVSFKFVVSSDADISEINHLVKRYKMRDVFLMAEGRTKKEQLLHESEVKNLCSENGFTYSPRLHVLMWGDRRRI